eukprot:3838945-Pyramimonas_sp.AAC.1
MLWPKSASHKLTPSYVFERDRRREVQGRPRRLLPEARVRGQRRGRAIHPVGEGVQDRGAPLRAPESSMEPRLPRVPRHDEGCC